MVIETLPFFIVFLAISTLTLFMVFLPVKFFSNKLTNRSKMILYFSYFLFCGPIVMHYTYSLILDFNFSFFRTPSYFRMLTQHKDKNIKSIESKLEDITKAINDLNNMRFKDVETMMSKIEILKNELSVYPSKLKLILASIKTKQQELNALENRLNIIKKMSQSEREIIAELRNTNRDYIITFFLGMLSSIISAMLINKYINNQND